MSGFFLALLVARSGVGSCATAAADRRTACGRPGHPGPAAGRRQPCDRASRRARLRDRAEPSGPARLPLVPLVPADLDRDLVGLRPTRSVPGLVRPDQDPMRRRSRIHGWALPCLRCRRRSPSGRRRNWGVYTPTAPGPQPNGLLAYYTPSSSSDGGRRLNSPRAVGVPSHRLAVDRRSGGGHLPAALALRPAGSPRYAQRLEIMARGCDISPWALWAAMLTP